MKYAGNSKSFSSRGFMLTKMQQGSNIQKLLDSVYDEWYYPTLFLNLTRKVEYYSRYSSEHDPWESLLQNGALINSLTDKYIEKAMSKMATPSEAGRVVSLTHDNNDYILTTVGTGGLPSGFLLMHCPRSRSADSACDICSALSETIAFLIKEDAESSMPGHDFTRSYIAKELLRFDDLMGNASPEAGIQEYTASTLWPSIRPSYRIAAVSDSEKGRDIISKVDEQICHMYSKSYSIIKSNTLYLFFYDLAPGSGGSDERLRSTLKRISKYSSVNIALSSRFNDINLRQVYRRQAVDLSRMSDSVDAGTGLLEADDLYPEQILYASSNRIGKDALQLTEITYLKDYDSKEGTEYLNTLCTYLRCSGIIRTAASELHIQPKSLRYRIKKISDILGRSSDDLLSDSSLLLSVIASGINP